MIGSIFPIYVSETTLVAIGTLLGAILAGFVVERLLFRLLLRFTRTQADGILSALVRHAEPPAAIAFPLLAALTVLPDLHFAPSVERILTRTAEVVTILAFGYAAVATVQLYSELVKRRFRVDVADNLRARQVETRVDILSRTVIVLIAIVTVALALMTSPSIRAFGTTLLASAGAAGIVVGLAARPFFENIVAGVQIALTQPIRLDDVVIVEKEFGHIESIGTTYVVVRLWDQRRIICPLTYFIQQPFENWTRTGSALIGSVMLYVDYTVAVADARAQLLHVLEGEKLWDGAVQALQVTDATATAIELRILVSARNAADLFDLRCNVREKMVGWLQEAQPRSLPVVRQVNFAANDAAASITTQAPGESPPPHRVPEGSG